MDAYGELIYAEREHYKRIKELNEDLIATLRHRVSVLENEMSYMYDQLKRYEENRIND